MDEWEGTIKSMSRLTQIHIDQRSKETHKRCDKIQETLDELKSGDSVQDKNLNEQI